MAYIEFNNNPVGRKVGDCGGHVVCAIDGDWFDSWDSGSLIVQSVWYRKENE